jgi:hypothetical protein
MNVIEIPFDKTFSKKSRRVCRVIMMQKMICIYLICDDRSTFNDSRFYTAKIPLFENKIQSVDFQSATSKNESRTAFGN